MTTAAAGRLEALTSLRFVAALLVFFWHAPLWSQAVRPYATGYYGVAFFFTLSGFIIGLNYASRLRTLSGTASRRFWRSRVARIYPLHLATLAVAVGLIGLATAVGHGGFQSRPVLSLVLNALLLQAYAPDTDVAFSYNGVAWSLSAEMAFYLLTPVLVPLIWRLRRGGWKTPAGVVGVTWLVYLAIAACQTVPSESYGLYLFPPVRMLEYFGGLCLGIWFYERRGQATATAAPFSGDAWPNSRLGATILELLALGAVAGGLAINSLLPMSLRFGMVLLPVTLGVILVIAVGQGRISRLLQTRLLVVLGAGSFAFYLLHQLVIRFLDLWLDGRALITWLALMVTVPLCLLAYRFVEEPARRRLS